MIVDGTGVPSYRGDVGIKDGRITALDEATGTVVLLSSLDCSRSLASGNLESPPSRRAYRPGEARWTVMLAADI